MSKMAASSPHLCLRWNNYQSNLTSVFDQLLQNETFVDVTLAADGHAIKAHRMVLSACSPYFQALFFDNPCQHPIVILKDTRWSELKAIVEYMYRGEISVAQEQLTSLLRVAETLKIRGLSELNGDRHAAAAAGVGDDQRSETSAGGAVTPVAGLLHGAPASVNAATAAAGRRAESPTSSWPLQAQPWSHGDDTPTPSPSPAAPRAHKRRRVSAAEVNSTPGPASPDGSTPGPMEDAASLDGPLPLTHHQSPASSTAASTPALPTAAAAAAIAAALSQSAAANQQQSADDLDIKPGIAELIREEERARMLEGTHPWLTASPSVLSAESLVQWRSKAPSWTKEQLQEAINSIVTQKMRFTQASSHYNIPKGTLYDNILGKSKRMLVLDEVGLDAAEEDAVLDFCCETSVMPYNRRTNKSLESILSFVEKLKHSKGQSNFRLSLGTILAFRWWWAFCKKHNIVSLFYSKNKTGKNSTKNNNSNHHHNNNNNNNESSSLLLANKSANNNLSPPPGDDLPENLSSSKFDDDDSSGGGSGGVGGGSHVDEGVADADGSQLANLTAPFYRSLNNNNIHLSQALQLGHAFLIRQGHQHNLRSRTHSVDQDEDSDLEPENLSVHKD